MIDEVFAIGEDGQAHFAETASPSCNRVPNRRLFGLKFRLLNVAKWPYPLVHLSMNNGVRRFDSLLESRRKAMQTLDFRCVPKAEIKCPEHL